MISLRFKPLLMILIAAIGLFSLSLTVFAQNETSGSLTVGQPVISEISTDTPVRYDYSLTEASIVTFQVISESIQPTITIFRGDEVVASEPNEEGKLILTFNTFLTAGDYVVEMGTANDTTGTLVLVVERATPVAVNDLLLGTTASGEMSAETSIALYRFTALNEPSLIIVSSGLTTGGVEVHLFNETLNRESGMLSSELLGGTFTIPANSASYRVEVEYSTLAPVEPFTICWVPSSIGACTDTTIVPTSAAATEAPVNSSACTVSPASAAVNIRSSASTDAPIIAPLTVGETAAVLGIAPDGFFFNIEFEGVNGWVAKSVVVTSGDCSNIPPIVPPDFIQVSTQVSTLPPVPTATSTTAATQAPTATNTPSGPCLLTLNSPVKVYTQPTEQVDYLFDQLQSGELVPIGRLADGSWWKTNYASSWVPTYLFGSALTVSGNCSLPIVNP